MLGFEKMLVPISRVWRAIIIEKTHNDRHHCSHAPYNDLLHVPNVASCPNPSAIAVCCSEHDHSCIRMGRFFSGRGPQSSNMAKRKLSEDTLKSATSKKSRLEEPGASTSKELIQAPVETSVLLRLPSELRNKIYEHVLTADGGLLMLTP